MCIFQDFLRLFNQLDTEQVHDYAKQQIKVCLTADNDNCNL